MSAPHLVLHQRIFSLLVQVPRRLAFRMGKKSKASSSRHNTDHASRILTLRPKNLDVSRRHDSGYDRCEYDVSDANYGASSNRHGTDHTPTTVGIRSGGWNIEIKCGSNDDNYDDDVRPHRPLDHLPDVPWRESLSNPGGNVLPGQDGVHDLSDGTEVLSDTASTLLPDDSVSHLGVQSSGHNTHPAAGQYPALAYPGYKRASVDIEPRDYCVLTQQDRYYDERDSQTNPFSGSYPEPHSSADGSQVPRERRLIKYGTNSNRNARGTNRQRPEVSEASHPRAITYPSGRDVTTPKRKPNEANSSKKRTLKTDERVTTIATRRQPSESIPEEPGINSKKSRRGRGESNGVGDNKGKGKQRLTIHSEGEPYIESMSSSEELSPYTRDHRPREFEPQDFNVYYG
ncbi:hypothetical protein F5Y15DRAFT_428542 [Xylariaceae sp. FL0016]|nr:hypothetical protein F5Y15DRAFT_428542 [Xylariaceae sp. FL0016]